MKNSESRVRWWRVGVWALGGFALGILSTRLWLGLFIAVIFGFARLVGELARPKPVASDSGMPPLSSDRAAQYQEAGLSEKEITLFRETMDKAADQIQTFEAVIHRVPKLNGIAVNADLVAVLHAYFKAIVQNPKQMSTAGHFLYEQLPNLVNIAQRYEAIDHHEVKTTDTFNVLTTAANTLADLAQAIRASYASFVETDIDALEADLALAQKQLPESTQGVNRLSVDQILRNEEHVHE